MKRIFPFLVGFIGVRAFTTPLTIDKVYFAIAALGLGYAAWLDLKQRTGL